MRYLLTKYEYDKLLNQIDSAKTENAAILQSLCTQVARYKPITRDWDPEASPHPWGCIITTIGFTSPGYCDDCPVLEVCPHPNKRWSK